MHEGIHSSQLGANFLRKICKENVKNIKKYPLSTQTKRKKIKTSIEIWELLRDRTRTIDEIDDWWKSITMYRLILIINKQPNLKVSVIFDSHRLSIIVDFHPQQKRNTMKTKFQVNFNHVYLKSTQIYNRKWHSHTTAHILPPSGHSPDAEGESS